MNPIVLIMILLLATIDAQDCQRIGDKIPGGSLHGIAYHPRFDALLAIGDEDLFIVSLDERTVGKVLLSDDYPSGIQDLCIADPLSDFVYIVQEYPYRVYELKISGSIWTISRTFDLSEIVEKGPESRGLEGITFVKDSSNPEGGLFYVGHQYRAAIYVIELPILSGGTSVKYISTIKSENPTDDITSLTSVDYTNDSGQNGTLLLVLFDAYQALLALDLNGNEIMRWRVNGYAFAQKGVAFVGDFLYISEEHPLQIWKYNFKLVDALEDDGILMECYRPTASVVIMIALFGCIYTVLGVWPAVQLIRMALVRMRMSTKMLMHLLILGLCIVRGITILYLGLNPEFRSIGLAGLMLLLLLPFCFSFAIYTLLLFIWVELTMYNKTNIKVLPYKLKPIYLTVNIGLLAIFFAFFFTLLGTRTASPTVQFNIAASFIGIIFFLTTLVVVGFWVYGRKLQIFIIQSPIDRNKENKQTKRVIYMTRVGMICGVSLMLSKVFLLLIYLIDANALMFAVFPMLLCAEVVPSVLILWMQRRVEDRRSSFRDSTRASTRNLTSEVSRPVSEINHESK